MLDSLIFMLSSLVFYSTLTRVICSIPPKFVTIPQFYVDAHLLDIQRSINHWALQQFCQWKPIRWLTRRTQRHEQDTAELAERTHQSWFHNHIEKKGKENNKNTTRTVHSPQNMRSQIHKYNVCSAWVRFQCRNIATILRAFIHLSGLSSFQCFFVLFFFYFGVSQVGRSR